MSHLSIKSLSKSYGAFKVFQGLDLSADAGEIVVIFGGSGTGKTTLLRLIAGVEEPSAGQVEIGGEDARDIAPEHRGIGMAFQNFALFPHMSAAENIASPLRAAKAAEATVSAGVNRVARLLKIDHVLSHAPRELSNGQKQRTALARALAAEPRILLLDDPLRNVDAKLRFEMRMELPRLLRQSGAAVLYVTQDYKEAMALADRIAVLADGRFVQVAAPDEIYLRPAMLSVARLFGDPSINTAQTEIALEAGTPHVGIAGDRLDLPAPYATHAGRKVVFAVRPEAVALALDGPGMSCEARAITPLNERVVLLLTSDGGWEFLASLPSSAVIPEAGARLMARFAAEGTHLFDSLTGECIHG